MGRRAILCALAIAVLASGAPAYAAASYEINVVLPLTGGGSFLGKGQQQALDLLGQSLNRDGGINGQPLKFVYHDDQTSPQVAVQLTNQIVAQHPSVIIGSSLVAMCNAMAPLVRNGPLVYCLSPAAHPADGSYMFSTSVSTADLIDALVRYFRLRGWTKLAILSSTDATGQDFEKGIDEALKEPDNQPIKIVERARFNQTDVSVGAQLERIKAAEPQALIAWTAGAAVATVFKGIIQAGLDMPIGTTNGNMTYAQMSQYADFLPKELYIPSSLFPPHDGVITLDPRVEAAQHKLYAELQGGGLKPDNMSAHVWDPVTMIVEGLRKLGPQATAADLKKYIEDQSGFAGINGVYDFKRVPQRGLAVEGTLVTRWDKAAQQWAVVSRPIGIPIAK